MTDQHNTGDERQGATAAQLKRDYEAGRTGAKVGGLDPGASPLGTDTEAGGTQLDPQLLAEARALETAGPDSRGAKANAATPELQPNAKMGPQRNLVLAGLVGVVAAAGLAALLFVAL
ncbi:hypothetical protein [Phenylobacterium deserti]|uniref:Uncharacterized protein n=1 Tax=Phenylobacterium deserti TaxID=1914756 RepID=A0A328AST2_9CAUL|nr:hypothetical protein [Phenylobacterium deserti]RAK57667.1 hypothetical protein DJ018_06995 [Phenylobacterium deserti]